MSYILRSSNFFQVPKYVLDSVVSLLESVSFVVKNAKEFQVKRVRLNSRSYKNNCFRKREYVNCREDGDGGGSTASSYKNYQRIKGVTGEVSDIANAVQSMSKACAHCHIERVQVATSEIRRAAARRAQTEGSALCERREQRQQRVVFVGSRGLHSECYSRSENRKPANETLHF